MYNDIGKELKEERIRQGITQREFAKRAGMLYQNVSAIERGGNANISTLQKMAEVLGKKIVLK